MTKQPWEMTSSEYYAAKTKNLVSFLPKNAVLKVGLNNGNRSRYVTGGLDVYLTIHGTVIIDGNVYSPGDWAYLYDNTFYPAPPELLLKKIEEDHDSYIKNVTAQSELIQRDIKLKNEPIKSFLEGWFNDDEDFKWEEHIEERYMHLEGLVSNRERMGKMIDEITPIHDPEAIKKHLIDEYLPDYAFKIGGYLHIEEGVELNPLQRQAVLNYREIGGSLGRTALEAVYSREYAREVSMHVYDIKPSDTEHKALVRHALKEGNRVPEEVLKEYPDLVNES